MSQRRYRKLKGEADERLEKFLGELQLAVMEVVWERGAVSVREVLETLNEEGHRLAYTTVMTIMGRLAEKGWLKVEREGRAFTYHATHSRPEAEAVAVGELVRALVHDFGDIALAQFVKELGEIDPAHLARLEELGREEATGEGDAS